MTRIPQIAAIALCLMIAACASMDKRERLAQAEIAYATVVETAADLRGAGVIDEEAAQQLTPAFVEANNLLQRAHDLMVDGEFDMADAEIRAAEALILSLSRRVRRHGE